MRWDVFMTVVCLAVAFVIIALMLALVLDDRETVVRTETAPMAPSRALEPDQASDCELRYRTAEGQLHVFPMPCDRITICEETHGRVPAPAYCTTPLATSPHPTASGGTDGE